MFRRSSHPSAAATATADAAAESEVVVVAEDTFLDDTAGAVALVDFWAPWCAPCRSFAPMYREVAAVRGQGDFRFGACNVDESPQTAAMLGIQTIPTVVAFDRAGNELARITGVPSRRALEELVQQAEAAR